MRIREWSGLNLEVREIYRAMGTANSGKAINPVLAETIEGLRPKAQELLKPRYAYQVVPVRLSGLGRVVLDESWDVQGDVRFFQGASEAVVAAATVGSGPEEEASRLFREGQFLEGLTIDAYGTAALDETMRLLRRELQAEAAARGQRLGASLSPGSQGMPLEEQRVIFSLLDGPELRIELTEDCLMRPVKSCTIIIPVGTELSIPVQSHRACAWCDRRQSCRYRPETTAPRQD